MADTLRGSSAHPTLTFPDALYYRYGFCPTPDDAAQPLSTDEKVLWAKTMTNLPRSPDKVPPSIARELIRAFHDPISSLPPSPAHLAFDLSPSHPHYVKYMNKGLFRITQRDGCYHIRARDPQEDTFAILTDDASSVLHVIRAEMHTLIEALSLFLQNGIPFQILRHPETKLQPIPPIPQLTLGHRSLSWHPGHEADYHGYATLRDTLLRHPAVARSALRMGGIPWRLALEANGSWILDGHAYLGNGECCSYELTEADKDLICGVYKVFNGYAGMDPGSDFADKSWFPKPPGWKTSGLNLGFWGQNAEEWYQTYRVRITRGEFRLLNQKQWKSAMLMMKKQRKISILMRDDAQAMLATDLKF